MHSHIHTCALLTHLADAYPGGQRAATCNVLPITHGDCVGRAVAVFLLSTKLHRHDFQTYGQEALFVC
ncbi:hypothetical protein FOA52_015860 [Chlamydomonas sp. UWO 241]|nr:hypothetical protein FOA52_015860 [Chlamydomonas sp. UWO 241]